MTATGVYWLTSCGDRILNSGMTVLVFLRLGMMPVSTDSWNSCENIGANSSAQVYRMWPEMLSGPAVFLMLVLLNWHDTSFLKMMITLGYGGNSCQKPCAPGYKDYAVEASVEFVWIYSIRQCIRSCTFAGTDITGHHIEISESVTSVHGLILLFYFVSTSFFGKANICPKHWLSLPDGSRLSRFERFMFVDHCLLC